MSSTLKSVFFLFLAVTASASPIKRSSGSDISNDINIITGSSGDPTIVGGNTCGDQTDLCHELCHVVQQNTADLAQCYDDCYKDLAIECNNGGGNLTNNGGASGPSSSS